MANIGKLFTTILLADGEPKALGPRRNCETDWAQVYPQYIASKWIGHGIEVSARHYLQVPDELYEKAAATNKAPTAIKTATKSEDIRSVRELKNSKLLTNKKLQKSG